MSALLEHQAQAGDAPGGGSLSAHDVLKDAVLPTLPGDVQRILKAQLLGPKVRGGFRPSCSFACTAAKLGTRQPSASHHEQMLRQLTFGLANDGHERLISICTQQAVCRCASPDESATPYAGSNHQLRGRTHHPAAGTGQDAGEAHENMKPFAEPLQCSLMLRSSPEALLWMLWLRTTLATQAKQLQPRHMAWESLAAGIALLADTSPAALKARARCGFSHR